MAHLQCNMPFGGVDLAISTLESSNSDLCWGINWTRGLDSFDGGGMEKRGLMLTTSISQKPSPEISGISKI